MEGQFRHNTPCPGHRNVSNCDQLRLSASIVQLFTNWDQLRLNAGTVQLVTNYEKLRLSAGIVQLFTNCNQLRLSAVTVQLVTNYESCGSVLAQFSWSSTEISSGSMLA